MEKFFELLPAVKNSGFRMEGYYVWCGSVIKEGDIYYLFAACWPKKTGFPEGYFKHSEIVLASTDDLSKPFRFEKVLLSGRPGGFWDSAMAHNPFVVRVDDTYVLYYIGSPDGSAEKRAIGYAYSKSIRGDFVRSDTAIDLPPDANNPAVVLCEDGSIQLYFRDGNLKVSAAKAKDFRSSYEVINDNLFPKGRIEDMFVFRTKDGFAMIAEDEEGAYTGVVKAGVYFTSPDGIHWDEQSAVPAYDFGVNYDDGSHITLQRRERPFILHDDSKAYLFTTAKTGGETTLTGGTTWNMLQEIKDFDGGYYGRKRLSAGRICPYPPGRRCRQGYNKIGEAYYG